METCIQNQLAFLQKKTVWNILNQKKYVGSWKYRQTKVVKNPTNDTLVQKERPVNEHIIVEREDLRVIPKDLERRVQLRKLAMEQEKELSSHKSFYCKGSVPKHLFVGSMKCAECDGNFIIISGRSGGYLGCFNAHRQSTISCQNRQMIKMERVEMELLEELKKHLDDPDVYKIIAQKYNTYMGEMFSGVPRKLEIIEGEIFEIEQKIKNYDNFISQGHWSDSIASSLSNAEESLKKLKVEREYLKAKSEDRVFITPAAIRNRMVNLDDLLGMAMPDANAKIKKLFPEKIAMKPGVSGKDKFYVAAGAINLYGLASVEDGGKDVVSLPFIKFERTIWNKGQKGSTGM